MNIFFDFELFQMSMITVKHIVKLNEDTVCEKHTVSFLGIPLYNVIREEPIVNEEPIVEQPKKKKIGY